jgi:hypothetical protein
MPLKIETSSSVPQQEQQITSLSTTPRGMSKTAPQQGQSMERSVIEGRYLKVVDYYFLNSLTRW